MSTRYRQKILTVFHALARVDLFVWYVAAMLAIIAFLVVQICNLHR